MCADRRKIRENREMAIELPSMPLICAEHHELFGAFQSFL